MCMQCVVDAVALVEDVVPGYHLLVSSGGSETWPGGDEAWPKGHLGLVKCNDPMFVIPPIPDPNTDEFLAFATKFNHEQGFGLNEGWELVDACLQAGYRRDEDGFLPFWLFKLFYQRMNPDWKETKDDAEA